MSTDKNIFIDLWLISFLTNRMVSEMLQHSSLSIDEFAMYGLISDLAPITSADLVRATGLPATTVSSMVRRCERRGELVRRDNPADARSSFLELTPAGAAAVGEVVENLLDGIERVREELAGQYDAVRSALGELDHVLRRQLGVGPRPYRLLASDAPGAALSYSGAPLTEDQADEARRFIDWLRIRDT